MLDVTKQLPPDSILLATPREFNFQECLRYLQRSPNECLYRVMNGSIQKLVRVDGENVLLCVTDNGDSNLRIDFLNGLPSKSIRAGAEKYVSDWFDLSTDLAPFYSMAENDPLLYPLVQKHFGLRIMGVNDLFEALCWAIMGQQINLAFAYTLKRRFVETYSEKEIFDGEDYWLFPTPERVAGLPPEALMKLQFTGKKAEYTIGVAKLVANGELSKEGLLQKGDYRFAEKELLNIRGIGPWTAHYVLLRCLKDPSAFPIGDVGLHNAIKQQLNLSRKPSIAEIRQLSLKWANWEAYATFYLWSALL